MIFQSWNQFANRYYGEVTSSKEVQLCQIPDRSLASVSTPIESMKFIHMQSSAVEHEFPDHSYGLNLLFIKFHKAESPQMRQRDTIAIKRTIESRNAIDMMKQSTVNIYAPFSPGGRLIEDHSGMNNPAMLLIASTNLEDVMDNLELRNLMIDKKATRALQILRTNFWDEFRARKIAPLEYERR